MLSQPCSSTQRRGDASPNRNPIRTTVDDIDNSISSNKDSLEGELGKYSYKVMQYSQSVSPSGVGHFVWDRFLRGTASGILFNFFLVEQICHCTII